MESNVRSYLVRVWCFWGTLHYFCTVFTRKAFPQ